MSPPVIPRHYGILLMLFVNMVLQMLYTSPEEPIMVSIGHKKEFAMISVLQMIILIRNGRELFRGLSSVSNELFYVTLQ